MTTYFDNIPKINFEGEASTNPLAFRYYDKNRKVLGKTMEEYLRFASAYWHTFCWEGGDPFGGHTFERPWFQGSDPLSLAKQKAQNAFDFFSKLGVPYYCFHDRDVAPEGATPRESAEWFAAMVDELEAHQNRSGVKLLWGTANLFSHRRFMSGAATNPDPAIYALAATQVRNAMNATHRLGGQNYVLWGGREGYETLLNTNLKQELDQMGRFLNLVVEHKHKIGFKGTILIEPKPREPSKHQYDFDVSTVYGFLCKYGLEQEVKVNIEANHATLAGHSFEHELAMANALEIFGSIDMNRGDPQLGWDTDQFPNNLAEIVLAMYEVVKAGGFKTGGINFDAKVRRQSIDAEDLFIAHIGGMDLCAKALLIIEKMLVTDPLKANMDKRYAGWVSPYGQDILAGKVSLDALADQVLQANKDTQPVSGKQEYLENVLNRFL